MVKPSARSRPPERIAPRAFASASGIAKPTVPLTVPLLCSGGRDGLEAEDVDEVQSGRAPVALVQRRPHVHVGMHIDAGRIRMQHRQRRRLLPRRTRRRLRRGIRTHGSNSPEDSRRRDQKESTRNARGMGGKQFPQRDQRTALRPCESPMTGSPPRGPGCMTGTKHQCHVGHGIASTLI